MTKSRSSTASEARPAPWAVALLVASSTFALVSIILLYTGYGIA